MFKITLTSNLRATLGQKIKNIVDDDFINKVNQEVVEGSIKPLIASGQSPVTSAEGRRFPKYKDGDKYPGKQKAKRPVNLYLSGLMLSFYKAAKVSSLRMRIGILPSAPLDVKVRAQANNEGTEKGIPTRRFIPLKGETYTISVMRKLKNLYAEKIKSLLSK